MTSHPVRVSLNASELAALVGMHAYKSAEEALVDTWRRFDPSSFYAAQKRVGVRINTVAQALRAAPEAVSHSVRTAVRAASEAAASGVVDQVLQQPLLKVDRDVVARVAASVRQIAQVSATDASATDTSATDTSAANTSARDTSARDTMRAAVQSMTCDARVVNSVVDALQKLATAKTAVTDTQVASVLAGPRVADCKVTAAAVASAVNTQRGSRHEEDGVQLYERATGLVVHSKNNCTYVRTLLQVQGTRGAHETHETRGTGSQRSDNESNGSEGSEGEDEGSDGSDGSEDEGSESDGGSEGEGSEGDDAIPGAYQVVLCGKVDGLVGSSNQGLVRPSNQGNKATDGNKATCGKIVEVKCRRGRFFDSVPLYELVQIHAYMFLTRRKSCDLVQKFGPHIRITGVEFDKMFWAGVRGRAVAAARALLLVRQSTSHQDALLRAAAAKQQQQVRR